MLIVAGISLIGLGVLAHLWVRRREFYRTNQAGVLEFKNYRSVVGFRAVNRVIILFGRLAILMGALSLFGFLMMDMEPPNAGNSTAVEGGR